MFQCLVQILIIFQWYCKYVCEHSRLQSVVNLFGDTMFFLQNIKFVFQDIVGARRRYGANGVESIEGV